LALKEESSSEHNGGGDEDRVIRLIGGDSRLTWIRNEVIKEKVALPHWRIRCTRQDCVGT